MSELKALGRYPELDRYGVERGTPPDPVRGHIAQHEREFFLDVRAQQAHQLLEFLGNLRITADLDLAAAPHPDERMPPAATRPQPAERGAGGGPEPGRSQPPDRRQLAGRPAAAGEPGAPPASQPGTVASGTASTSAAPGSTSGPDAPSAGALARPNVSVSGELFGGNGTPE